MDAFLPLLGSELEDASEETFALFTLAPSTPDLGMLSPRSHTLALTIHARDYTLAQSPSALNSHNSSGTTGAAVWQTSLRFATWLSHPANPLFRHGILGPDSSVLELGAGVSGLNACELAGKVGRVVVSDMPYALKLLRQNVAANLPTTRSGAGKDKRRGTSKAQPESNVDVAELDWETSAIPPFLAAHEIEAGPDVVIACDCVYNYALIEPFINVCREICEARDRHRTSEGRGGDGEPAKQTVCIIAQHLRQPDVFEQWAETFTRHFRTWRVEGEEMGAELGEGSGFAVFAGVLK